MKRILVVEDDKDARELLKLRLSSSGYEVFSAAGGKEALSICNTMAPDLVLMDIAMPEMNGYQTCERLRECDNAKNAHILFITGKDLEPKCVLERCQTLGACGYIKKPYDPKELLEKIRELIG